MRAGIVALIALATGTVAVAGSHEIEPPSWTPFVADTAEALAREAIAAYYETLRGGARPEACRGVTLEECFGGDMHCAWWGRMCNATFHAPERATLLARLEALQGRFPTDDFVVGQLVNFGLKDGDPVRALESAERCEATRWWCQALRGYSMHAMVPGSGDSRFDSALATAPDEALAFGLGPDSAVPDRGLRCEWTHAGHLWPDGLPPTRSAGGCGEAQDLHERFWWLADPLWSVPGNERLGEHISRNIAARLMYDLDWHVMDPAQARVWWWAPFNLHEEWTRNGFYNSWRTIVRIHEARPDTTHQLYVHGGYSFAPDSERFLRPEESTAEDWAVAPNEGPERMVWATAWHPISDHQTVLLRRGEGLVAMTAARLPVLVSSFDGIDAALALGRPSDLALETVPAVIEPSGVMRARTSIPAGQWVASVEARGPEWVGRTRFGAPAPVLDDGVGVSPPLFVRAGFDPQSDSVDQALLPSTTLTSQRLGVYFELYGVDEDETLELTLSIERADRSWLGRIGSFFGVNRSSTLTVGWTEVTGRPREPGYVPRSAEVDLSGLDDGTYKLTIGVAGAGGVTLASSALLTLRAEPEA